MLDRIAEAWLLVAVLLAGLSAASLALLMFGRLLGREWVTPIDDELIPSSRTIPLVALFAIPPAFFLGSLYAWAGEGLAALPSAALRSWFEPVAFLSRSAVYFAAWIALALFAARQGKNPTRAVIALVVLALTLSLAGIDWVLGREPFWWSTMFGFAFAISQLAPALALALLANAVQQEHVDHVQDRSLTSALLTLSLAIVGVWFAQFLTAWMGNLPEAAHWYQARLVEGRWMSLALAAITLTGAVVLLILRASSRPMIVAAAVLVVVQHLLHMAWLLRPFPRPALGIVDFVLLALLGGIWFAAWRWLMQRHDRRPDQSGRFGASNRGRSGGTGGGQSKVSADSRL